MTDVFSAGVLVYRHREAGIEVLLGHMGGPFWAKKDASAWSIPKGEYLSEEESARDAARREFTEELGLPAPEGEWIDLGEVVYRSGAKRKYLTAWAVEGDLDPADVVPGTFEMEWPPRSGRLAKFPEVDRVDWFDLTTAAGKLGKSQRPFLTRFTDRLP
ncbi:NUDIX domain-containing protein [Nocardia sp. NPDC058633]|uniref:NUDIX domain-containing protein n=1 Tax=Nocardia sp. NPDC058633 TaxID=3346568 RepID=UPI00365162B6